MFYKLSQVKNISNIVVGLLVCEKLMLFEGLWCRKKCFREGEKKSSHDLLDSSRP